MARGQTSLPLLEAERIPTKRVREMPLSVPMAVFPTSPATPLPGVDGCGVQMKVSNKP